jgi:rod shape-determining protein MreD
MIDELNPRSRRDPFGSKIDRDHSRLLATLVPVLTVMLGSLTPLLPFIAAGPIVPPFGFMAFLAWRIVRPGLLPLWIGIPLGAFDDMFSGQPLGSAIMLWSATMLALEMLEVRFPWRGFLQEWGNAAVLIAAYLAVAALISGSGLGFRVLVLIVPQVLLSILLFPIVARMISVFDRLRLLRIRDVSDSYRT